MILDLYAGPGGWETGLATLGITDVVGVELDRDACTTRRAAGHRTIRGDADIDTAPIRPRHITGLIASPPCQQFSQAGGGGARVDMELTADIFRQGWPWHGPGGPESDGARHILNVGEWIEWAAPEWICLEQVPPVLPLWEAMADWLREDSYHVWTGVLCAADYGVPQTRRRAILIASRTGPVRPPEPTHAEHPQPDLWGHAPQPWVTMADALGWPSGDLYTGANSERADGLHPYTRDTTEPAPTVDAKAGSAWQLIPGSRTPYRAHPTPPRPATEPAPTLAFGRDSYSWCWTRPATTIAGDPRCHPPGHKTNADSPGHDRAGTDAIRLTLAEALTLQGFPADYPVAGSRTSAFRQVGNAIPPPLAAAVVTAATAAAALEPAA